MAKDNFFFWTAVWFMNRTLWSIIQEQLFGKIQDMEVIERRMMKTQSPLIYRQLEDWWKTQVAELATLVQTQRGVLQLSTGGGEIHDGGEEVLPAAKRGSRVGER